VGGAWEALEIAVAVTEWLFKAMADGTRRKLLRVLVEQELSVSELVEVLGQPQSTISRHLKVLREARLVVDRRAGSVVMYSVVMYSGVSLEAPVLVTKHSAGSGERNGSSLNGAAAVREWLLGWIGGESLDAEIRERMQRVVRERSQRKGFYERVGHRWDQLRIDAFGHTFHLEAMVSLLPGDWTAADIGTGTGYFLPVLSSRFAKVVAVDPEPEMLRLARQRDELKSVRNIDYREGSLERLPIEEGEVDLLIASLVLHHLPQPAEAFDEMYRCLKREGTMLVIEQRVHRNEEFQERMGDRWRGFAPKKLANWASDAGLTDIEVKPLTTGSTAGRRMEGAPPIYMMTARKK